jgi:hypothetical protein
MLKSKKQSEDASKVTNQLESLQIGQGAGSSSTPAAAQEDSKLAEEIASSPVAQMIASIDKDMDDESVEKMIIETLKKSGIAHPTRSYDGWRWHKWGTYIGDYNISGMEYLAEADGEQDNPKIDEQWLFNLDTDSPVFGLPESIPKFVKNGAVSDAKRNSTTYAFLMKYKKKLDELANFDKTKIKEIWNEDYILRYWDEATNFIWFLQKMDMSNRMMFGRRYGFEDRVFKLLFQFFEYVQSTTLIRNNNTIKMVLSLQENEKRKLVDEYNKYGCY